MPPFHPSSINSKSPSTMHLKMPSCTNNNKVGESLLHESARTSPASDRWDTIRELMPINTKIYRSIQLWQPFCWNEQASFIAPMVAWAIDFVCNDDCKRASLIATMVTPTIDFNHKDDCKWICNKACKWADQWQCSAHKSNNWSRWKITMNDHYLIAMEIMMNDRDDDHNQ